jgi:hypothetical protein
VTDDPDVGLVHSLAVVPRGSRPTSYVRRNATGPRPVIYDHPDHTRPQRTREQITYRRVSLGELFEKDSGALELARRYASMHAVRWAFLGRKGLTH